VVESWLRAGERQQSLQSLEEELHSYYAGADDEDESSLRAALGKAARRTLAV